MVLPPGSTQNVVVLEIFPQMYEPLKGWLALSYCYGVRFSGCLSDIWLNMKKGLVEDSQGIVPPMM